MILDQFGEDMTPRQCGLTVVEREHKGMALGDRELDDTFFREKLRSLKDSPVYKDGEGKWRLAREWAITELEVKRNG